VAVSDFLYPELRGGACSTLFAETDIKGEVEVHFASQEAIFRTHSSAAKLATARLRTIVIDDSPSFLEVICELLQREDAIDIIARGQDGMDAIEMTAKLNPDLVLMDVDMPQLDGLNAALIISTRFPSTRVILMSVEDSPQLRADCVACGGTSFVDKSRFTEDFDRALAALQEI